MKRKRRTEILIKDTSGLASECAEAIRELYPVMEIQPPQEGLVMVKLREQARNSLFYLGEVLVTEAKVRINGYPGLGLVRGNNKELAGDLAVIDAAWLAGLEETAEWEILLLAAEEENIIREQEENGKVLETKVDFASMQEEDYV